MSLLSLIALSLAQAAPSVAAPDTVVAKPVKICREGGRTLGTHMRKGRVCKTAEAWEAEKKGGNYIPSMTIRRTQDAAIEGLPKPTCCD